MEIEDGSLHDPNLLGNLHYVRLRDFIHVTFTSPGVAYADCERYYSKWFRQGYLTQSTTAETQYADS